MINCSQSSESLMKNYVMRKGTGSSNFFNLKLIIIIQQIFVEYLLCAKSLLSAMESIKISRTLTLLSLRNKSLV